MDKAHLLLRDNFIHIARMLLRLEWVWIALMIIAFWHRSPPFREQYVFLLGFAIPIYGIRWWVYGRLFTRTPLDIFLLIFVVLTVYNFQNAPISRADYWVLVCRPLLGIFIIYYFAEHIRQHDHIQYLVIATILLGLLVGGLALLASQWGASDKSELFAFLINGLPVLDHISILPDMQLSFNPNEIAGALAYFCPFFLGIALKTIFVETISLSYFDSIVKLFMRWGSLLGFLLTAIALFLGQSRFALAGVFVGVFVVILFVLPNWKLRFIGLSLWLVFLVLEIMIVTNVFPLQSSSVDDTTITQTDTILDERDERTLFARFDLWERALRMVRDYPTTGAGMSTYRALVMQDEYIIPLYEGRRFGPPHAHNAFLQLGADLGVMGLFLFIAWYGTILRIAYQNYKFANLNYQIMTVAITSGILSYIGYGMGDTITLWDRFAFLHWWFIALAIAVYIKSRYPRPLLSSDG